MSGTLLAQLVVLRKRISSEKREREKTKSGSNVTSPCVCFVTSLRRYYVPCVHYIIENNLQTDHLHEMNYLLLTRLRTLSSNFLLYAYTNQPFILAILYYFLYTTNILYYVGIKFQMKILIFVEKTYHTTRIYKSNFYN